MRPSRFWRDSRVGTKSTTTSGIRKRRFGRQRNRRLAISGVENSRTPRLTWWMRRELLRHWPEKQESESGSAKSRRLSRVWLRSHPNASARTIVRDSNPWRQTSRMWCLGKTRRWNPGWGYQALASGLRDPRKPIGCFLMTGPTGVGKTELARQLSATLEWNSSGTT